MHDLLAGVVGLNLIVCKRMADNPKSFSSPGVPASHSPCVPGSRRSVLTDATLPLCQGDCLQGVSQARFWVIHGPQHRSLLSSASVIISLCCPCRPFLAGVQAPGRLDQRRVEAGQGGGLPLRDPRTASHMPRSTQEQCVPDFTAEFSSSRRQAQSCHPSLHT